MHNLTKYVILFVLIISLISPRINGQTGSIEGTITDKENSETLIGATIQIEGTTIGTATDLNGHFVLNNLKAGVYRLKVSYVAYTSGIIENVTVEPDKVTTVNAELEGSLVSLGDVTVTAVRRTNTEISVMNEIKTSQFVTTGISSQQISKTLDKDASEVVKRVPGITIMDNRFLVVRGLSQRYNNVWLNDAATPSAEADVKAFSFDVIPSSMIENIMVVKSPAAELPADFSGGFVRITTKNLPEKNGAFISYGTGISENTTFREFYKPVPGGTDWLGFDDGSRALPADMPQHLNDYESATNPAVRDKITSLGREMNNSWLAPPATAFMDQKFSAGLNLRMKLGKHTLGNLTGLTYSLTNSSEKLLNADYSIYDYTDDKPSYLNQFIDQQYSNSGRISLMNNTSLFLGKGTKIEIRNLLSQSGASLILSGTAGNGTTMADTSGLRNSGM